MRKISSAIFLVTLFVFANCKNNAGETAEEDQTNKFYQSVINLGNGFIDVFSSFVGSIADALGLKANPKKSDVKTYFDGIAKKLEETLQSLEKLTKENGETSGDAVESAVGKTVEWLKEMIEAAKKTGEKNGGAGNDDIGNVADAGGNGAKGNAESVKAIASGMKGIVDAAKKAGVELKGEGAAGTTNADAGKLFNAGGNDNANAAAVGKAASAVSKVSGKQILNAIVTSGGGDGKKAGTATNPNAAS